MTNQSIAIVGATGKTGARVSALLQERGYSTRDLSRRGDFAFDWADRDTWQKALEGVRSAYVTYYPDLAVPQAEEDIRAFVDKAKSVGIEHIVLLSGRGEEGARRAEDVVINSGLVWNVVRASWFMQNFSESFMLEGLQAGELVLPESKASEPFIDVNDIAEVAVAALTRSDLHNQLLEVTGSELLTFDGCVEAIAAASNRSIGYQTISVDAYLASAPAQGLPEGMAWLIRELFVNVLDGRNESTTDTVQQLLGRPAKRFREYVQQTAETGVWAIQD